MRKLWFVILMPLMGDAVQADPALGLAVRGGPCAATFNQDYRIHRYGVSAGLAGYLELPLSTVFSLGTQVELSYAARGAEIVIEDELQGKNRLHYFELLLAARPTVELGQASIYLLLGGGLSLLGSARDENAAGISRDVTDELHRVDVTLLAGAGAALRLRPRAIGPLSLGAVFVEARHEHGLLDVDKLDLGFKNRTTSLMIGVSFALASRSGTPPATSPSRSVPPPPMTAAASAW